MNDIILSPFSLFHSHEIQWGNLKKGEEAAYRTKWTKQEADALNGLKVFGIMTLNQMLLLYWNGNKAGRKSLRRMAGYGIIGEHMLVTYNQIDHQVIRNETALYMPRWMTKEQQKLKIDEVLQKLVLVQLYLKIKPLSDIQSFPAVAPFTGNFHTPDETLSVAVVKNNTAALQTAFRFNSNNRMIVVIEQESHIPNLEPYCCVETQWMIESELFGNNRLTKQNAYATF